MTQRIMSGDGYGEAPWRDEQRLRSLYVEQGLSQREIAEELGCSRRTVGNWLDRFDIERDRPWQDAERLAELRDEGLSMSEIADRLGTCQSSISRWMRKYELDTSRPSPDNPWHDEDRLRELYWGQGLDMQGVADRLGCSRITVREWMDQFGIETRSVIKSPPDELTRREWLREAYVEDERSTYDIADELGCVPSAVFNWLNRHDIETRNVGSQPGELHHRWKGGFEPYYGADWSDIRESVLQRDGHRCTECGMSETVHQGEYGYSLHVHHIEPIREFDHPEDANTMDNLITLCHACHMAAESGSEGDDR